MGAPSLEHAFHNFVKAVDDLSNRDPVAALEMLNSSRQPFQANPIWCEQLGDLHNWIAHEDLFNFLSSEQQSDMMSAINATSEELGLVTINVGEVPPCDDDD
jgi:hypothetical protein